MNCLLKCAEQLSCQKLPDARFYTQKLFTQYLNITWYPTLTSSKLKKETVEQEAKYVQR